MLRSTVGRASRTNSHKIELAFAFSSSSRVGEGGGYPDSGWEGEIQTSGKQLERMKRALCSIRSLSLEDQSVGTKTRACRDLWRVWKFTLTDSGGSSSLKTVTSAKPAMSCAKPPDYNNLFTFPFQLSWVLCISKLKLAAMYMLTRFPVRVVVVVTGPSAQFCCSLLIILIPSFILKTTLTYYFIIYI